MTMEEESLVSFSFQIFSEGSEKSTGGRLSKAQIETLLRMLCCPQVSFLEHHSSHISILEKKKKLPAVFESITSRLFPGATAASVEDSRDDVSTSLFAWSAVRQRFYVA